MNKLKFYFICYYSSFSVVDYNIVLLTKMQDFHDRYPSVFENLQKLLYFKFDILHVDMII